MSIFAKQKCELCELVFKTNLFIILAIFPCALVCKHTVFLLSVNVRFNIYLTKITKK